MPVITNSNVVSSSAQIADGIITNADIDAAAAIAYSKLNLAASIVNADIGAGAAIVDTKLAVISTAGKVSGAALTSLPSIPSGAGAIPLANLPSGRVAALTSPLTIVSTTVETNIFTGTLNGGTLGTAGGLSGWAFFDAAPGSGVTGTITYRLYMGATVIASIVSTSDTTQPGNGRIDFMILAAGATNSQRGVLQLNTSDERLTATGTAAIDSTVNQTIKLTAQNSVSNAAFGIVVNAAMISAL